MDSLPTEFAPAERAGRDVLDRQQCQFRAMPMLCELLNAVPDVVLVLNKQRQIVFGNRALLQLASAGQLNEVVGQRPGEALDCDHAKQTEGGCGTTEFCQTCGAVKAILNSQAGHSDVQECRVTRQNGVQAMDLRVWATPLEVGGERFTIFTLADISNEKRRRVLERLFFHDVLNTAGALKGYSEMLHEATVEESREFSDALGSLSGRLVDEIRAQRELMAAEANELSIEPAMVSALRLLREVASIFAGHEVGRDRFVNVDPGSADATMVTDPLLLARVLGNMVKNALEATAAGGAVTAGARVAGPTVEFWVHNSAAMPRPVQLQIFQRSYSTKGSGRGLGTYSMKLLGEKYLGGKISFESAEGKGTTFFARMPLGAAGAGV